MMAVVVGVIGSMVTNGKYDALIFEAPVFNHRNCQRKEKACLRLVFFFWINSLQV